VRNSDSNLLVHFRFLSHEKWNYDDYDRVVYNPKRVQKALSWVIVGEESQSNRPGCLPY
jgi:hypothetical protein